MKALNYLFNPEKNNNPLRVLVALAVIAGKRKDEAGNEYAAAARQAYRDARRLTAKHKAMYVETAENYEAQAIEHYLAAQDWFLLTNTLVAALRSCEGDESPYTMNHWQLED